MPTVYKRTYFQFNTYYLTKHSASLQLQINTLTIHEEENIEERKYVDMMKLMKMTYSELSYMGVVLVQLGINLCIYSDDVFYKSPNGVMLSMSKM